MNNIDPRILNVSDGFKVKKQNGVIMVSVPKDWADKLGIKGTGEERLCFFAHSLIKGNKVIEFIEEIHYKVPKIS